MTDPFCHECGNRFYLDANGVSFHEPDEKDTEDGVTVDECFMLDLDHAAYNLEQVSWL